MNDIEARLSLIGLSTEELTAAVVSAGERPYRGKQLSEAIYRKSAATIEAISILPGALRHQLAKDHVVGRSTVVDQRSAKDGTFKLLLGLHDGERIETVGLPYEDRFSCCVSTQVGCSLGCTFCATGAGGFRRNLSAGEIVDQVLTVADVVRAARPEIDMRDRVVDHVTYMGMGEPLLNYDSVLKSIRLLNAELGIASRNLTLSTSGLVPAIRQLAGEHLQITLAISLHAPNDAIRARLMPGVKWRVAEIVEAARHYVRETGRRVTFEYCMMEGINDGAGEAEQLAILLRGLNCHVNLIPFNSVGGSALKPSSRVTISTFREVLSSRGIQVTQREEKGSDIDAACGQLRRRHLRGAGTCGAGTPPFKT